MIEYFVAFSLGILFGTFTGLIPGIHINLVSATLISYSYMLLEHSTPLGLGVFIMSMSVTHTFLDSIPSIFLGAPDSDMALGVLPGHRYLLKGLGFGAVYLTLLGSFLGLILSLALFPLLLVLVGLIYPIIKGVIGYLLVVVVILMILREKKKIAAAYIFVFSGALGLIIFGIPNLNNPLFPLLSGLFGVSALLLSIHDDVKVPKQKYDKLKIRKTTLFKNVGISTLIGFFTSFLPGKEKLERFKLYRREFFVCAFSYWSTNTPFYFLYY